MDNIGLQTLGIILDDMKVNGISWLSKMLNGLVHGWCVPIGAWNWPKLTRMAIGMPWI